MGYPAAATAKVSGLGAGQFTMPIKIKPYTEFRAHINKYINKLEIHSAFSYDFEKQGINEMRNLIIKVVGKFPSLIGPHKQTFPPGIIVLRHGKHTGANKGFGAEHILAEHKADLKKHNLSCDKQGVIQYVEMILQFSAGIYCEFSNTRGFHRPMIIRSKLGTVVLERQERDGLTIYSVVTAFGGTMARGTKIGTMPRQNKST